MINLKDLKSLERGLEKLRQKMEAGARLAVARTTAKVFVESQDLVPVSTGNLKSDVTVSEVVEADEGYAATIAYHAPYAAIVHENLNAKHPHGQAKYLEVPLHQAGETLLNEIAKAIK